jgi:sugar phosphate isomerase/epimerase
MRLGLSSYTFTWAVGVPGSLPPEPLSPEGLVDKAAALGVGLVQIADNLPLEKLPDGRIIELYRYARKHGVQIEMGGRGLTAEHTGRCLETAALLHSPILRMVIDQPGFQPDKDEITRIINGLIPELEKKQIRLAIENHDRFKAETFKEVITSIDSEWVGICLDSVNSMGAGEGFETVSDLLMPYTINLHVKDFIVERVSHKMGFIIEGRPAGSGMLDIRKLVQELTATGKCRSAILELWTPPCDNIQATLEREDKWAQESIDYLKKII